MSTESEMTPELWRELEEMEKKQVVTIDTAQNENTPDWIVSLRRIGYLDHRTWGPGDAWDQYCISEEGKRALAEYRTSQ